MQAMAWMLFGSSASQRSRADLGWGGRAGAVHYDRDYRCRHDQQTSRGRTLSCTKSSSASWSPQLLPTRRKDHRKADHITWLDGSAIGGHRASERLRARLLIPSAVIGEAPVLMHVAGCWLASRVNWLPCTLCRAQGLQFDRYRMMHCANSHLRYVDAFADPRAVVMYVSCSSRASQTECYTP